MIAFDVCHAEGTLGMHALSTPKSLLLQLLFQRFPHLVLLLGA